MEKSTMLLAVLSVVAIRTAEAQIDSARQIRGAKKPPSSQSTSPTKQSAAQEPVFFKEDRIEMDASQLPDNLRKTLTEGDQYRGWENNTVYFDRASRQYILHMSDATTTRTYFFDENGQPVSDDSARRDDQ